MMWLLRRTGYFFRKGVTNLKQHLFINIVAIGTIAVSFFLIGSALIIYENMKGIVVKWGEKIQVTAYFKDGVKQEAVDTTLHAIREIEGVSDVSYVTKDQALRSFRTEMKGMGGFFEGIKINPLPSYCEVVLKDSFRTAEKVKKIASLIQGMDAVDDVQFGQEWVEKFSALLQVLRLGGIAVGAALLCAVIFIVSNTIKLSLYARREEIEIMKLVGGTNFFVRIPFVIEGGVQGLLGTALSLGFLYSAYRVLIVRIGESLSMSLGIGAPLFLSVKLVLLLLAGGMGLGVLGSITSLGRFVK